MRRKAITISRRQIAIALVAAAGTAALPQWLAAQTDTTPLRLVLPPVGDPNKPTFEVFLALSQIVTMRAELDRPVAMRLFELFKAEPWGQKHIGTAYAVLRETIMRGGSRGGRAAIARAPLPDGERWFISHLVTTWYVGVYYHPERPTEWTTLNGALMFGAARGLIPARYMESTGFGRWTSPPDSEGRK